MNSIDRPAFRRLTPAIRHGGSTLSAMKARYRSNRRQVMVAAHRGDWDPLPENSLAAVRAASRWGVVEVDVRLDRRGVPILMHDQTVLRMTGEAIPTDALTAETCRGLTLRAGAGGTGARMTDECVPTLDEAFAMIDGTGAVLDLDVKRMEHVEAVARSISALGCQDLATLKVPVRSIEDIAHLVELERTHDIMCVARLELAAKSDLALVVALREADAAAVDIDFHDVNLLASATAFASDLIRFGVSTLEARHSQGLSDTRALQDPRAVWGRLITAGVRSILTDQPDRLSRYLLTR